MKILLVNYNHDLVGGCETMYRYLNQAFPNSEFISVKKMFKGNLKELSEQFDKYILERNKSEDILVIKEAEIGGVLDTNSVPQINIFQNPYLELMKKFNFSYDPWVFNGSKKIFGKKVTVSNYMNIKDAEVIPNCVDIGLFKPESSKFKIKHDISEDKKIAIWVGSDSPVKNFQMILNLIEYHKDIFWILISKEEFNSPYTNSKVFHNIPHTQVSKLLNCADFFILTSPIEGCGLAILEAMACDLPCIISKAGYFYDFWDDRIGIQIKDSNNFNEHKEAISLINKINTNPRKVIFERGLDLNSWKNKWNSIIQRYK